MDTDILELDVEVGPVPADGVEGAVSSIDVIGRQSYGPETL